MAAKKAKKAKKAAKKSTTAAPRVLKVGKNDVLERDLDATLEAEFRKSVQFMLWGGLRLPIPHDAPDAEWTAAVLACRKASKSPAVK